MVPSTSQIGSEAGSSNQDKIQAIAQSILKFHITPNMLHTEGNHGVDTPKGLGSNTIGIEVNTNQGLV
jgi:hypothetical protein